MKSPSTKKPAWLIITGVLILGIWALPGCRATAETATAAPTLSPSPEFSPSDTPQSVFTPQATPTETVVPTPTAAPLERPQYEISATLNYAYHRVVVEEHILVPHPAREALEGIDLVVPPNNWWGVFSIEDISSDGEPITDYSLNGVRLHLDLGPSGWLPGESLQLTIHYTLDLPQLNSLPGYGPSPFGYTSLQTNLVDWYPMVPPYQEGEGWLIHDPWIFGEYLVYPAADFEIRLALGTPGLIVAASGTPLTEGDPLRYSLTSARNFVFSVSPAYQVLREDLNGVEVSGYIFPGYQVAGEAAFRTTVDALALYQDLFGPYQQPSLSMVQADFNHGMEYEGLYFQSRAFFDTYNGTEKNYLVMIAAHETAHQWWYGQVANDQAFEPWLDEAFCTMSELAYYENLYPQSVDWWWYTRVNYYNPSGRIDRSIYGFQEYTEQYLNYRNATYLQGVKFMAALKDRMGDEAFYRFIREYADRNRDLIVTRDDFFALLGEYLDLSELVWLRDYFLMD